MSTSNECESSGALSAQQIAQLRKTFFLIRKTDWKPWAAAMCLIAAVTGASVWELARQAGAAAVTSEARDAALRQLTESLESARASQRTAQQIASELSTMRDTWEKGNVTQDIQRLYSCLHQVAYTVREQTRSSKFLPERKELTQGVQAAVAECESMMKNIHPQ